MPVHGIPDLAKKVGEVTGHFLVAGERGPGGAGETGSQAPPSAREEMQIFQRCYRLMK